LSSVNHIRPRVRDATPLKGSIYQVRLDGARITRV
jgi:hypothetical protein